MCIHPVRTQPEPEKAQTEPEPRFRAQTEPETHLSLLSLLSLRHQKERVRIHYHGVVLNSNHHGCNKTRNILPEASHKTRKIPQPGSGGQPVNFAESLSNKECRPQAATQYCVDRYVDGKVEKHAKEVFNRAY